MYAARIDGATRCLAKPGDMSDDECHSLHVRDVLTPEGNPVMLSAWVPTPEELQALMAGGHVVLGVCGNAHPPVFLIVTPPPGM